MRTARVSAMTMGELRRRYEQGENITQLLRTREGFNEESSIEAAYDLQSGSYVRELLAHRERWERYTTELGRIAAPYVRPFDTILDCGTGEMTTLFGVESHLPPQCQILAFDISLSRIVAGVQFLAQYGTSLAGRVKAFCAPIGEIPLPDKCIDVVFTAHALEPNRGREEALLRELFRVSRRYAILFEPSYEHNSEEGRQRMDHLGYIRDLDRHIASAGGKTIACIRVEAAVNPLNPTFAWIVEVGDGSGSTAARYACPISGELLAEQDGVLWSSEGLYAYPVYRGIPILKASHAIILTKAGLA